MNEYVKERNFKIFRKKINRNYDIPIEENRVKFLILLNYFIVFNSNSTKKRIKRKSR